ncbi:hypothetical protein GCM10023149_48980 [Mucilaginibacter gynuensis]|uniref:Uncharacterized protein n=1 Tax=Mucilaginibacter gynuensis TaxID=1302236 RepID=A0ABP8HFQ9_9SPHI
MARYIKDPWAKKSKKGLKLLNSAVKIGAKAGKATYRSYKKTSLPSNNKRSGCTTILILIVIIAVTIKLII